MGKVKVTIIDSVGNMSQSANVPDDIAIGRVIGKFIQMMNMPTTDPSGALMSYKVQHKNSGKQFNDTDTLAQHGVKDGDVLRLLPEITAG